VLLQQVPFPQLKAIIEEIRATVGPAVTVEAKGGPEYVVVTATHDLPVTLMLDQESRISGILFKPPVARNLTLADAIKALGPDAAYLVLKNGEPLFQQRADMALAVGSAFKLGVLAAIKDRIEAGALSWDSVVTLTAAHKSLPTGLIQDWPDGSPLTIHSLAALMISLSDNTATDVLLETAGREAVAAKLGIASTLSTREFFVLKTDEALRARYLAGDATVLAEVAKSSLPTIVGSPPLHQQGLEWYVPAERLCALMDDVGGLDVMQINPGVTDRKDWQSVAFKGGSETGVLNLTTAVVSKGGDRYCVSATWNEDAPINQAATMGAYAGLMKALAQNP
jgi:beta-lactamase class A